METEGIINTISLQEFQKVQLTTGKILTVEDHPKADKLYVLKVDIGEKTLQIVAGMKPYYTKEEMQGRTIIVIKNLEPAELRGITSEGMLLAAEKEGKVVLLGTEKEIGPGAKIK
ncbi:MAG: methionine--tRNA ligase subunit beta [Nanoarchaeota archaeon]|nr:methionine--tRNA ligase subunit beta [Nanoarchaeota archaeon]